MTSSQFGRPGRPRVMPPPGGTFRWSGGSSAGPPQGWVTTEKLSFQQPPLPTAPQTHPHGPPTASLTVFVSCFGQRFLLLERGRGRALGTGEELTKLVSYNSPVLTAWWRSRRFCPFLFWLVQSDHNGERLVGHGENPGCKLYHVISCLKCPRQPPIS